MQEVSDPEANFQRFVASGHRTKDLTHPPVPHQERRAVFLEKRRTDRPGEARVVELDAEIVARFLAAGAAFQAASSSVRPA